MDIKQIKEIKSQLTSDLKKTLENFVSGGNIDVSISDDMETLQAKIQTAIPTDSATTVYVSNVLIFNTNNPDNIMFSGSNRTVVKSNDEAIAGIVGNNSQVDLLTLSALREALYNFCLKHDLINKDEA